VGFASCKPADAHVHNFSTEARKQEGLRKQIVVSNN